MEDTRLVRDLLEANLRLTEQVIELARLAVGAPQVVTALAEQPAKAPSPQDFRMSTEDDWQDIPDKPMPGHEVHRHLTAVPEIDRDPNLPIAIGEEEEDLRYRVGMGLEAPQALTDLLRRVGAPGIDIEIKPNA